MAAETEIIREFLVSLGFRVDKTGLDTFVKGITAASSAVLASVTAIEDNLERLYFASQRTKASAENIRAFGFALGQMGSSAGAALETIENLARFMRNSPGASGLIESIGVQTKNADGALRDTSDILRDLGKQFANMPYYRANAYAQALGIDEKTLMALRQGLGDFGDDYRNMLVKAGLNLDDATKKSHAFMVETRTLGSAFAVLGTKISSSLSEQLTAYVRRFRDGIVDNFGRITDVIDRVVKGVLWLSDVISTLALRAAQVGETIVDWWNSLDESTKVLIETVLGLAAAFFVFNKVFNASPLGRLLALASALLLLYDDYRTWKEGGKSLIDWEVWETQIDKAMFGLSKLGRALRGLGKMAQDAWAGKWSALPEDWEEVKNAWNAADVGGGNSQANVDAYKTDGGVRLTPDAQRRISEAGITSGMGSNIPAGHPELDGGESVIPGAVASNRFAQLERQRNLPDGLLDSVWNAESGRGRNMTSPVGAQGHFQFMPATAREYGLADPNDLSQSAEAAAHKYADLLRMYAGDVTKAIAGYNWGQGNLNKDIAKWGDDWLAHAPRETQQYVARVTGGMGNPYRREQLAAAGDGRSDVGDATPVTISQNTTIQVTGSGNSESIGQAVASQQDGVNQRLVRNMRSAVQ